MSQITRKKSMKIQKRLGIKFGFTKHVKETKLPPDATIVDSIKESLAVSYENGFGAFVLPSEIIGHSKHHQATMEEIYKSHYDGILRVKDLGQKHNIQLALRSTIPIIATSSAGIEFIRERLRVLSSAADIMNAKTIVIHPGPYKGSKADAIGSITEVVGDIAKTSKVKVSMETTGKKIEFGTLDEVLDVAKKTGILPSVHFGHIYARSGGKLKTTNDFLKIFEKVVKAFPLAKDDMFMFVSGVLFDKDGENKHVPFEDSDFPVKEFMEAVRLSGVSGTVIVDSPNREEDVLYLMNIAEKVAR